jgi:hypothetical protein
MFHRIRAYILGAVAAFGLVVAVGRPLLKLQDESSLQGNFAPVFSMSLLHDASPTTAPVALVP